MRHYSHIISELTKNIILDGSITIQNFVVAKGSANVSCMMYGWKLLSL